MFEPGSISNNGSPESGDEGSRFLFTDKMFNKYLTKLDYIFEDIHTCGLTPFDAERLRLELKERAKEK